MTAWKVAVQRKFEKLADTISLNPKPFLASILITTLLFTVQIFWITFDTTTEGFLPADDPAILQLEETRDQYGRADFILLTIESPQIFSFEFINKLKQLHQQLENELPWLDSIDSLLNARDTRSTEDGMIVGELFEPFPESEEALLEIKTRVLENPLLRSMIISADGRFTTLVIKPITYDDGSLADLGDLELDASDFDVSDIESAGDFERDEADFSLEVDETIAVDSKPVLGTGQIADIIEITEVIVAEYQSENFVVYMGGMPVVLDKLVDTMIWEILTFMPMAIVVIVIMLGLMFRRRVGIQFPMMTVVFTLLTTIGLFCAVRFPVQMPMMIVPTFILTVTVGGAVHFMSIFFQHFDAGEEKADALRLAMGTTALPIMLTSMTTAASLLSFAGTPIVPLSRLGIFSSIGVMIALAYTLILIPALITRMNIQRKANQGTFRKNMVVVIDVCINISTKFPWLITLSGAAILIFSLIGMSQLKFSHNPLEWLPEDLEARTAIETIDANMGGSIPVEIVIDSGKANGLHNPVLLQKLDELTEWLEAYENDNFSVAKVVGLTYVVKESHKALNEGRADFYVIADDEAVIANELFMFENSGPDQLRPIVDSQFQQTRLSIIMPWIDTIYYRPFIEEVQQHFDEQLDGLATAQVTGVVTLLGTTLYGVIITAAQSYGIAFLVITIMMMALLSSIRLGLVAMIPNVLPIMAMMGLMHSLNIPLDMFTILVVSIAIGIAVDDTVHFMYHFQHHYTRLNDAKAAIRNTLHTSGRAMLTTSIVLCLGFSQLMWSSMHNITNFGMLISMTIFFALVADFLLAPALMMIMFGKKSMKKPD